MKLRGLSFIGAAAALAIGAGCGDSESSPADTSTTDTTSDTVVPPDVADDAGPDVAPDVTPDVAPDVPPDVEPDVDLDTTPPDTADTGGDTADIVIPEEIALLRGDRCEELSTLTIDGLPINDSVDDTSIFSDRYIYSLGEACGGSVSGGEWGDASPDVVYAFTPIRNGQYTFVVTPTAGFDAGVMVTDACPPRNVDDLADLTCLGAVDDGREGVAETVAMTLTAGVTYYVLVDGFDNDNAETGGFTLNIELGEDCSDRVDNDDNGDIDCADAQCFGAPACDEFNVDLYGSDACANSTDDDGDGATDCADVDCAVAVTCREANCSDELDDNGNGLTDCEDPGCQGDVACGTPGDECARAIAVGSGASVSFDSCESFTNTAVPASSPPGCSLWSTTNSAPDVWYRYDAATTGVVRVTLNEGSGWDAVINVIDGASCPTAPIGTCLAGRDGPPGGAVEFDAVEGSSYYIIVDGYSSACGTGTLAVQALAPEVCDDSQDNDGDGAVDCNDRDCLGVGDCPASLPGDSCESPFALTAGAAPVAFDTCEYEDSFEASAANGCALADSKDILYRFTAPRAATYRVTTFSDWSDMEHSINAVIGDTCPASPLAACDAGRQNSSSNDTTTFDIRLEADETVWLLVDTYWSSTRCGVGTIGITALEDEVCDDTVDNDLNGRTDCDDAVCLGVGDCRAALPGEGCANPIVVDGDTSTTTVDTCDYVNSFQASGANGCESMGSAGDVVATVTAAATGRYRVVFDTSSSSSGGTSFDSVINVVKADTCPSGSGFGACVVSVDDGDPETLFFDAVAGETFWIVAGGFSSDCGDATLTVSRVPDEICDNDTDDNFNGQTDCADAACADTAICDESATVDGCTDGTSNDNDDLIDCADPDCADDATACPGGLLGDSCEGVLAYPAGATNVAVDLCDYTDRFVTLADVGGCVGVPSDSTNRDVVVAWTATATGRFAARAATTNTNIILYRTTLASCENAAGGRKIVGECTQATNAVTATSGTERLDFDAVEGETYHFIVDATSDVSCTGTTTRTVTFDVTAINPELCDGGVDEDLDGRIDCFDSDCFGVGTCPDGIPGDSCDATLTLDGDTLTATLDTCTLTNDYEASGSDGCQTMGSGGDLLATFTATEDAAYAIRLDRASSDVDFFDSIINVVTGDTCPTEAPAACVAGVDGAISGPETLRIDATAGTTYWVIFDAWGSNCGQVTVSITKLSAEICDDDIDNDQNGSVDCDDPACGDLVACNESLTDGGCSDDEDNDGDGLVDCDDPDCRGIDACPDAGPGDACSTAIALSLDTVVSDDTCDYEDNYSFVSGGGCTRLDYEDVLYRFEAPSDGNYRVRAVADWLDLEVAVNVVVADECPATAPSSCSASAVNDFEFDAATTSSFAMTAGQTAWIVVGSGFSSQDCGLFSVEVEAAP